MSDNVEITRPADPTRINIHQKGELGHWAREFGVTPIALAIVVRAVGPEPENVKAHLRKIKKSLGK